MPKASNKFIKDMFHESIVNPPNPDRMLDGIMGNCDYDEFERGEILKLLKNLEINADGKILDAGAGIGRNIPVLRAAGFKEITAIDFAPGMVAEFRKKYNDLPCYEMDLTNMKEFKDDHFETTFCMYVLIHITDDKNLQKAISELERVTKGLLIIGQVMDAENKIKHKTCVIREYFEIHPMFKKKKLFHHYKNLYEIPFKGFVNRISFSILR